MIRRVFRYRYMLNYAQSTDSNPSGSPCIPCVLLDERRLTRMKLEFDCQRRMINIYIYISIWSSVMNNQLPWPWQPSRRWALCWAAGSWELPQGMVPSPTFPRPTWMIVDWLFFTADQPTWAGKQHLERAMRFHNNTQFYRFWLYC